MHCLVITATLTDTSLKEYTCYVPGTMIILAALCLHCVFIILVDSNSCTVIQQGQRVEYDLKNNITTFYFGPIADTTEIRCSLDSRNNFGPCKLNTLLY